MNDEPISRKEQWRPVFGWEDFYEISSFGRVRSKLRLGGTRNSTTERMYGGKLLVLIKKKGTGYLCVTLHRPGQKVQQSVHRLVLESFIGLAPTGYQACHGNAVRDDNRLENLRWDSVSENQAEKALHGHSLRGEKSSSAKLTEEMVRYIRASSLGRISLANKFGVSKYHISNIRRRKTWVHI